MAGKNRLGSNTSNGKHRQTSILQLLKLPKSDHFRGFVFEELERIQTKVTRFTSRSLQHLGNSQVSNHLGDSNEEEDVAHGTLSNKGIVSGGRGEAFVSLGERVDVESHVGGYESSPGEHGNAAMLNFSLSEVVHREVVGKAERVESSLVTNVSSNILRVWEERKSGGLGFGIEGSRSLGYFIVER
jgi:hypothetical protein